MPNTITGTVKVDLSKRELEQQVILPVGIDKSYAGAETHIQGRLNDNTYSEEETISIGIAYWGEQHGMTGKVRKNFTGTTDVSYKEKSLKPVEPNVAFSGRVSGNSVKNMARSFLKQGSLRRFPLWHSGFWITVDTIAILDRLPLDAMIADRSLEVGMNTAGLIYSNDVVLYNEIVLDFIVEFIKDTSLKLDDNDNIRDYIDIADMDTLTLALINALHPNGVDISMGCKNVLNEKVCNYVISGKADPKEMLSVDIDKLREEQLEIISKTSPNSVTKDEIKKYRDEYSNSLKEVTYSYGENDELKITVTAPTVNEYIQAGDVFIRSVESNVDAMLMEDKGEDDKHKKIDDVLKAVVISKYISFISSISLNGAKVLGINDIFNFLNTLSDDTDLTNKILSDISDFISDRTISVVGTPVYTCPNCRKATESGETTAFENIVPLNVIKVFSKLRTVRAKQMETL